jgi:hypothetical protein
MTSQMRRYVAMTPDQQAFVADFLVTQVSEDVMERALRYGEIVDGLCAGPSGRTLEALITAGSDGRASRQS